MYKLYLVNIGYCKDLEQGCQKIWNLIIEQKNLELEIFFENLISHLILNKNH